MSSLPVAPSLVQGSVEPGFEGVRFEFERNFRERGEIGAAFAVYHRGRKVVDLWGGHRDRQRTRPWQADSLTTIFSSTKGIAALTLAHAHARGLLEWDMPVAEVWPEFAQAGKGAITIRELQAHQAGLCAIDVPLDVAILADPDRLAPILAAQAPAWAAGARHGYHAISLGWYQSELLRRVDPARRTLGRYFREEIAAPLGLDIHIGLPETVSDERVARIVPGRLWDLLRKLGQPGVVPARMVLAMFRRRSLTARAFGNPRLKNPAAINTDPGLRAVEIPSANGMADARSVAKLYGTFATGGDELGIGKRTLDDLTAEPVPPRDGKHDVVLRTPMNYALGLSRPDAHWDFASSGRAFGTPGAGGSFCFADPDARLGMAYIMNRMGQHLIDDPREKALRDATYRAVAKIGPGA